MPPLSGFNQQVPLECQRRLCEAWKFSRKLGRSQA